MDEELIEVIDDWHHKTGYKNRSSFVRAAVVDYLEKEGCDVSEFEQMKEPDHELPVKPTDE